MATFNVSFLNPSLRKKTGSTGVGILSDQLTILQSELSKDGYLSSGDYDLLITKAQEIRNSGSLTADQMSNFDVKIANFQALKSIASLEKDESIDILKRTMQDEQYTNVLIFGNSPEQYLQTKQDSLLSYINELSETIERRTSSLQDTTEHQNELNNALSQYRSLADMQNAFSSRQENSPINGYVAYVETNSRGEIIDIDFDKYGSKGGYVETNGMIDGFQVYGKVNSKRNGYNQFYLGNNTFSGVDMIRPDPTNPNTFQTSMMIDQNSQKNLGGTGFVTAAPSWLNISGQELSTQSYMPNDSWAKGANGTVYYRRKDGGYTKYLNVKDGVSMSGIPESGFLRLPSAFESSLMQNVDETFDAAMPMTPDEGLLYSPIPQDMIQPGPQAQSAVGPMSRYAPAPQDNQTQQSISRTKQPTDRSPLGFYQNAKRTMSSAINKIKSMV